MWLCMCTVVQLLSCVCYAYETVGVFRMRLALRAVCE